MCNKNNPGIVVISTTTAPLLAFLIYAVTPLLLNTDNNHSKATLTRTHHCSTATSPLADPVITPVTPLDNGPTIMQQSPNNTSKHHATSTAYGQTAPNSLA